MIWTLAKNSISMPSESYENLLIIQIEFLLFLNNRNDELERLISESSVNIRGRISKRGNSFLRRTIWQI